jgi:ribose 5-phosphate isomerase A
MKTEGGTAEQKRVAGESAATLVEDGMTVGLGTGSTAAHAVRAIGEAVADGLDVRGVPTSLATRALAREAGVPLVELEDVDRVDLAIDGADQVANGDLVKGGGGAHAREKVVAGMAERFVVVVDPSKLADRLDRAVPVAVLPDARTAVAGRLRDLGGDPSLRDAARKDGPVVTDDGHLLLDAEFGTVDDPAGLASDLAAIPGVVEHGLFVDMADEVHVGRPDGATVDRR